jgi:hypothetical protein
MFASGNSPVQIVQVLGLPVSTVLAVIECARQKKLTSGGGSLVVFLVTVYASFWCCCDEFWPLFLLG